MERFGAAPGSPYTAKQIQHISIAVMYFFGGAIGIALELGWLTKGGKNKEVKKRWHEERGEEMDVQPYRSSYNPFAALCIGVTGIAMAAHHQTYLFQVRLLLNLLYFEASFLMRNFSIGSNSRPVGNITRSVHRRSMLDLLLPLAQSPTIDDSISTSHRSVGELLAHCRRVSVHQQHGTNRILGYEDRTR